MHLSLQLWNVEENGGRANKNSSSKETRYDWESLLLPQYISVLMLIVCSFKAQLDACKAISKLGQQEANFASVDDEHSVFDNEHSRSESEAVIWATPVPSSLSFLFEGGVCSIEITSPPLWGVGFSTGAGKNVRSTGLSGGVELRWVPQSVPTRLFTLADSELGEIKIRPKKFSSVLYIVFSGGLKASQGMGKPKLWLIDKIGNDMHPLLDCWRCAPLSQGAQWD